MDEPVLALAVSARDWPDRLREFLADHGGARVRLTALSVHDLEEDDHDVLVIDDISSMLSRRLIDVEHAAGRKVIGVVDRDDTRGRALFADLGVDVVLAGDESAEVFVSTARRLGPSDRPHPAVTVGPEPQTPRPVGKLVDVRGVSGGVGTSEIAVTLATALGDAVVVELSPLPSLAQRLSAQLHPNIATAVEVVDHGNGDVDAVLQPVDAKAKMLIGTSEPFAAGRGSARRVLDALRRSAVWTLVDGGAVSTAPAASDQTVFVTTATPVGITRCADALRDRDLVRTHIVLNRAPRGKYERSEVMASVLAEIRPCSITLIPEDASVAGAAWNGVPVGGGPFRRAVEAVAHALVVAA